MTDARSLSEHTPSSRLPQRIKFPTEQKLVDFTTVTKTAAMAASARRILFKLLASSSHTSVGSSLLSLFLTIESCGVAHESGRAIFLLSVYSGPGFPNWSCLHGLSNPHHLCRQTYRNADIDGIRSARQQAAIQHFRNRG